MCQSHTGRLTGLWFLPKPAFGLNTNDDDDDHFFTQTVFSDGSNQSAVSRGPRVLFQRIALLMRFDHTVLKKVLESFLYHRQASAQNKHDVNCALKFCW